MIGHPQEEKHVYGWISGLKRVGGKLLATFADVTPEFASAVNAGRYKKVSVRLRNTDRGWTLRHVGFLGAAAPAVEGLQPIEFAEHGSVYVDLDFIGEERREPGLSNEEWNERLRKALQREREIAAFIAAHEGKLPPALRHGLAEFMSALPDERTVEFSSDGERVRMSPLDFFKNLILELMERGGFLPVDEKEQLGLVAGDRIDTERLELHQKAKEFAERNFCSYEEAVWAITSR
ncbi:hypothetical protein [Aneurinibacillus danicus]|uniref:hypothetical protein n=1 Tax=Aneurinibacillus danicus TaxID=267746 RepID=UPI0011BE6F0C|nr:hypothetical protein [Aneurinibacillus danicus]